MSSTCVGIDSSDGPSDGPSRTPVVLRDRLSTYACPDSMSTVRVPVYPVSKSTLTGLVHTPIDLGSPLPSIKGSRVARVGNVGGPLSMLVYRTLSLGSTVDRGSGTILSTPSLVDLCRPRGLPSCPSGTGLGRLVSTTLSVRPDPSPSVVDGVTCK